MKICALKKKKKERKSQINRDNMKKKIHIMTFGPSLLSHLNLHLVMGE